MSATCDPVAALPAASLVAQPLAAAGLELALVAATAGAAGWLALGQRTVFAAESASHGLLPGLALAAAIGAPLAAGAVASALVFALVLLVALRAPAAGRGPAIAATATFFLAVGALATQASASGLRPERLLFGDPLATTTADIFLAAAALAATAAVLARAGRHLVAALADARWAHAAGIAVGRLRLLSLAVTLLAVSVAASTVGGVLALVLVVAPAVTVHPLARGLRRALWAAPAVAIVGSWSGLALAWMLDTATGATVAATLVAMAAVSAACGSAARQRGAFAPRRRKLAGEQGEP